MPPEGGLKVTRQIIDRLLLGAATAADRGNWVGARALLGVLLLPPPYEQHDGRCLLTQLLDAERQDVSWEQYEALEAMLVVQYANALGGMD